MPCRRGMKGSKLVRLLRCHASDKKGLLVALVSVYSPQRSVYEVLCVQLCFVKLSSVAEWMDQVLLSLSTHVCTYLPCEGK